MLLGGIIVTLLVWSSLARVTISLAASCFVLPLGRTLRRVRHRDKVVTQRWERLPGQPPPHRLVVAA
ncbi:hypothetical protein E2C01_067888 [Portunus trituberculatus]|uniref:Uncharacterized protein n=1 Tax=Portunus trituberculatus TaxID=210409 RepID=A0A5B7HUU6_PORTR|nr:hypothetical protein [Portunus trituberculatus]